MWLTGQAVGTKNIYKCTYFTNLQIYIFTYLQGYIYIYIFTGLYLYLYKVTQLHIYSYTVTQLHIYIFTYTASAQEVE